MPNTALTASLPDQSTSGTLQGLLSLAAHIEISRLFLKPIGNKNGLKQLHKFNAGLQAGYFPGSARCSAGLQ